MTEAPCVLSVLRPASPVDKLLVKENASACVGQPPYGPMGQRPGCNMGQTVFARGDSYNPDCVPTRRGNPVLPTASERGQTVSTEGSGDMDVDLPMPVHGSSPHSEPAVIQVGLDVGAGLDGPATSDFACAATKDGGGGELPVRSKATWYEIMEEEEQGGQLQKGSGDLQALHAATMGDMSGHAPRVSSQGHMETRRLRMLPS